MGRRAVQVPGVISARKGNLNHSRIYHGEETKSKSLRRVFFRGRIVFFHVPMFHNIKEILRILTKYGCSKNGDMI